ncbi:MAG: hypothetical protein JXK04_03125 [Campylobacterales bacterium]|nr:hypothetical protein [Campylobacterales bacterium]
MRPALFLLTLALLLAGCHSPQEPLPYPLTLSEEGLGAIHPGERYDPALLQSKMPGFTLEKLSLITPGKTQTLLALKRGDHLLAHIFPDGSEKVIERITLHSDRIKDPRGQGVGDPIQEDGELHCDENRCTYGTETPLSYRIDPKNRVILEITLQKL